MRRILGISVLVMAVAGIWQSSVQSQKPKKERNPIMQEKLDHSQKVLEGLAVRDFDLIERNADELIILSKKAEWRVLKTPEYTLYSDAFRRQAADLVRASKDKNLDGAALAYLDLTMSCVRCHKHVRETKVAMLDRR